MKTEWKIGLSALILILAIIFLLYVVPQFIGLPEEPEIEPNNKESNQEKCKFGCLYVSKLYTELNFTYEEMMIHMGKCHSMCRRVYPIT